MTVNSNRQLNEPFDFNGLTFEEIRERLIEYATAEEKYTRPVLHYYSFLMLFQDFDRANRMQINNLNIYTVYTAISFIKALVNRTLRLPSLEQGLRYGLHFYVYQIFKAWGVELSFEQKEFIVCFLANCLLAEYQGLTGSEIIAWMKDEHLSMGLSVDDATVACKLLEDILPSDSCVFMKKRG